MAGLDNYLSTLKDNAGMAGGFNQGIRDRAGLDTTLAGLAQKKAELQRYTGETPSYLQKSNAQARTAELANLQPEAEATLGVPEVKAGTSLTEAKISAEKADEVRRQLGPQKTMQMLHEIEQQSTATLGAMRQYLSQYPTADQAIAAFRQSHPQLTQDPGFNAEAAKYKGKPSAQALQELEASATSVAKGIANAKAETQAELMKVQAQGQNQKDVANIQAQASVQGDRIRAAASGAEGGKENTTMAIRRLSAIIADPNTSEQEKLAAEYELTAQLKFGQQRETSPLGSQFDKSKEKLLPSRPGSKAAPAAPDIKSLVEASGAKYEPNKFDYRINPETGKVQKKPKGN